MANREVFTNVFQLHYPHLDKPQPNKKKPDEPGKHGIKMAFPKVGTIPPNIGVESTDVGPIMQALEDVCQEEWKLSFADAAAVRQISFPPAWKDGDTDWAKDDNGNLLVNKKVNEHSVGKWLLSVKNVDPIGMVDHTGDVPLQAKAFYAGCWCKAQLSVDAYTMDDGTSIIAIKCLNVQKAFDGEPIGSAKPQQAATQAFKGKAIAGSNCQPTDFQGNPTAPTAPVYQMTAAANGHPREAFLVMDGWTDALLIERGMMVEVAPTAPGQAYLAPPALPGMP